jgi:hypothetical protein
MHSLTYFDGNHDEERTTGLTEIANSILLGNII